MSKHYGLTLCGDLFSRLLPPKRCGQTLSPNLETVVWYASGRLPLNAHGEDGKITTPLCVSVGSDWLFKPPIVQTADSFIRRDGDWHVYGDGALCYVLGLQWEDRLSKMLDNTDHDIAFALDYAATWLLSASDSLITRHWLASRCGIEKWPEEWGAYGHGSLGAEEYERELKKKMERRRV